MKEGIRGKEMMDVQGTLDRIGRKRRVGGWSMLSVLLLALARIAPVQAAVHYTYYVTNAQGTVVAEMDSGSNVTYDATYRPYGQQQNGVPQAGPGYTGHVNDPDTGLVYMQARYYDPQVGRFLSEDPLNFSPGDIYKINDFSYANNNPVVNIDPTGTTCETNAASDSKSSGKPCKPKPEIPAPIARMRATSNCQGCNVGTLAEWEAAFEAAKKAREKRYDNESTNWVGALLTTWMPSTFNQFKKPTNTTRVPQWFARQQLAINYAAIKAGYIPYAVTITGVAVPIAGDGVAYVYDVGGQVFIKYGPRVIFASCSIIACGGAEPPDQIARDMENMESVETAIEDEASQWYKIIWQGSKQ